MLCFLHGYDEAAPHEIRGAVGRHGPLSRTSAPLAVEDFLVVAPQLPMAGDLWRRFAEEVRRLVRQVQDGHGGDPRRTYLTGFSFGGNGVFDLGAAQPDTWAALWAVDPTRVPLQPLRRPVWLSIGEVSRNRWRGFVRALDLRPVDEAADGDRLYLDQGADHVGSARLAYADPRIYRWLLARSLGEA